MVCCCSFDISIVFMMDMVQMRMCQLQLQKLHLLGGETRLSRSPGAGGFIGFHVVCTSITPQVTCCLLASQHSGNLCVPGLNTHRLQQQCQQLHSPIFCAGRCRPNTLAVEHLHPQVETRHAI